MLSPSQPLFSIVIPLYNQQLPFFQQALESALNQTYPHIEVIVSDNHSTNDVPAFLTTIQDPRLRVVKPPEFLPMVRHFQFAADQATGDYISFLCSDDWIYPTAIETLADQLLANPKAAVAYCEIENVDHKDITKVRLYTNRKKSGVRSAAESLTELLHSRPFFAWIPGGIMKRSAYEQVRYLLDGAITYAFDVALLFKLHEHGDVIYIDKPLAKFRVWTAKDGKLGGARLLENIGDLGKSCQLLEESPRLINYLPNGVQDITEWRAYQAKRWIMALLVGIITGTIDAQTCREGIKTIDKHISPNPTGSTALAALIAKPQIYVVKPALNLLYRLYLSIQYRTKRGI
ncbi:glycosyltransferase family 2 protein [Spirosoma oryzicola]|uniref:glycosyltransferase family 2 protein n=1 Tax=Spirosoma oryzicola TaxID=2898794 RepID=UPI001E3AE322|nr:glycosyltransferase family 2 protein [Spirosoma oryzicola]UHG90999.1 glycosyltransferase family 2 protein [Spirosoma oryzicola]